MNDATLRLQATTAGDVLDARRGVVAVSGATMAALGLDAGDAVLLSAVGGAATTTAVVRAAPVGTHPFRLLAGATTLANLGVGEGADIDVGPVPKVPAERVVLSRVGSTDEPPGWSPAAVRMALLGRIVSVGDRLTLLPEDLSIEAATLSRARSWMERVVAAAPREIVLSVLDVAPRDGATITMSTVVAFADGDQTSTSATVLRSDEAADRPVVDTLPAASSGPAEPLEAAAPPPGLDATFRSLSEWFDLDFHHRDLLDRLGSGRRLGVLVTGPAGSGKVSVVRAAASAAGARCIVLWGPQLAGLGADAAVARIRAAGEQAAALTPAVLLIEDVDAVIGTARPSGAEGTLLAELRARVADPRIAVVCTSSRPDACDPRLREPGLLEREVEIALFTRDQRREALAVLTAGVPLGPDVDLADVAGRTPGFVLADLVSLVHEAGVRAAHRHQSGGGTREDRPADAVVSRQDVADALGVVRPSGAEGGSLEVPDLTLDDVGDMVEVKAALTETLLWPLTHPDTFARLGVQAPRGVLLYGPPGCGKTFLVRALAGSGQVTVLPVKGAEVLSKWVGESERGLREVFRRARQSAPALVFLDEIDALAPQRGQSSDSGVSDRVVAALLTELDGIDQMEGVSVIGATNRPDLIDSAVLRPGRLERLVFVPPPDAAARALILASAAKRSPLADTIDLDDLGVRTEGYSAADCAALIREAALTAMRRSMESTEITSEDMAAALAVVRPSLDPFQVNALEAFAASRAAR